MDGKAWTNGSDEAIRPRDFIGYGPAAPAVTWPGGAVAAVNFAINYEEGSEQYQFRGDPKTDGMAELNWALDGQYRDFSMESVYEYGSRAGIWRLLRIFDEFEVPVTFFATAVALESNPLVGEAIAERGHEPCSHGYRWTEPWLVSREQEREDIARAVESIERSTGSRPVGWYSRYSSSPATRDLLVEEGGFLYDSEAYNDDLPYFTSVLGRQHLVIPYSQVYNDVHFIDGSCGSPRDFYESLCWGLDQLRSEGAAGQPKMMSIGLHPRWSGQAGRALAIRRFLEHAAGTGDVWFARRADIARWWIDNAAQWSAPAARSRSDGSVA